MAKWGGLLDGLDLILEIAPSKGTGQGDGGGCRRVRRSFLDVLVAFF